MNQKEINNKAMNYHIYHTDMILERKEDFNGEDNSEGITFSRNHFSEEDFTETKIVVENEKGAKALGKPCGSYITIEGNALSQERRRDVLSTRVDYHVDHLLKDAKNILFVGLGNERITPDALGPMVIDDLLITKHLSEESVFQHLKRNSMGMKPGVMAQTGMETAEKLRSIVQQFKPDALVVIDALAARDFKRLCASIQISDTGICPGSGVRNHRQEISEHNMGVPVIALGVPTVISIPAIAAHISHCLFPQENFVDQQTIAEKLDPALYEMFVTPKDMDERIKGISKILIDGLNRMLLRKNRI